MAEHDREKISSTLASMPGRDFLTAAQDLLAAIGYRSELKPPRLGNNINEFIREYPAPKPGTVSEQAFRDNAASACILFQITDAEIASGVQHSLFDTGEFYSGNIRSFLFVAIELKGVRYPRGQYAEFTREINKRLIAPAVVLFRAGSGLLTVAFVHRREHKRDRSRDVQGRVFLIREIDTANPHRAHLDILEDLSLEKRLQWMGLQRKQPNFDSMLAAWLDALDTEELNRRFYRELFDWFNWAVEEAKFPSTATMEQQVIRLITRILFVWFIKEKGLVREEWFVRAEMKELLNDFGGSDYYRAVLQNLFFATLNTEMGKRGFTTRTEPSHRVFSRFRYRTLIRDTKRFEDLMKQTPFINGGLFDCLDDEESRSAGGKRIDMFSDPDPSDSPRAAQARREAWRELEVPDALFFDEGGGLLPLLNRFKFTVEENTPIEQEVALDPELLGKVFENLLAAYNPETRETARKQTGSYYTPRAVVDYMVDEALVAAFAEKVQPNVGDVDSWQERLRYLLDYEDAFNDANDLFEEKEAENIVRAIAETKVLDPAVGSGAFPMAVLHKLTLALRRLDPENALWENLQKAIAGMSAQEAFEVQNQQKREAELKEISDTFEKYRDSDFGRKLYLIQNSIYGVDIQTIACQIAKLRFFITLAIEQSTDGTAANHGIKPLPNLETRFVAADSLLGLDKPDQFTLGQTDAVNRLEREIQTNRERHFHANTRQEKLRCIKVDQKLRNRLSKQLEKSGLPPGAADQIAHWDPYDQNDRSTWFDAKYMFGAENGFDLIIGNPPYIQLQKDKGRLGKHYKDAGYDTFQRTGDIYQLFYESGCRLLRPRGLLAYITSNSWLKSEYGKSLRCYITEHHTPLILLEMGKDVFENTIVDTSVLLLREGRRGTGGHVVDAIDMDKLKMKDFPPERTLWGKTRPKGEEPWSILSRTETRVMEKLQACGTPLKEWDVAINMGIKTGYNEAYIIDDATREDLITQFQSSEEIIKPVLRGRDIKRYQADWQGLWLIDTHNGYGNIPAVNIGKYPAIKNHLDKFYPKLQKRQDKGRTPYNLRNCAYHQIFDKEKLFWMHMAPSGRFAYSGAETYFCNQKAFVITGISLKYLCAILNSRLITWKVNNTAVTTGMGLIQWDKFVVERLPIPKIAAATQRPITRLVDRILKAKASDPAADTSKQEAKIDQLVYELYGLTRKEIRAIEESI